MDEDDLPSLDDIFSRPIKLKSNEKIKNKEKENLNDSVNHLIFERKRSRNNFELEVESVYEDKSHVIKCQDLSIIPPNTPVMVLDSFIYKNVPAIVLKPIKEYETYYEVKYYDGRIETMGRTNIFTSEDSKFYSTRTISLKEVLSAKGSIVRPLKKESIIREVEEFGEDLVKILKGEIKSERDESFRSGLKRRSLLNLDNAPGPLTHKEFDFLIDYLSETFISKVLKEKFNELDVITRLEERFGKKGDALNCLLRQYAHLVLVPELILRIIMKQDEKIKSLEEANEKLSNSNEFDRLTGNFINYLYSKQEMYRYARRE